MCKAIEDMLNEYAQAVTKTITEEVSRQKTVEFVLRMVDMDCPVELIAYATAITEDQVKEIAAQRTA